MPTYDLLAALKEGRNVPIRPLAYHAGVTPACLYATFKRDPEGVVRVGRRAVRVTPPRARRILGLEPDR